MNIGKAIKEIRKEKGITQVILSKKSGITQAALSQIESGSIPHNGTLTKICKCLKVSEALVYLLAIEHLDVPKKNKILYDKLFPTVKTLILQIATEN
jgi:transcriptional regulator with XRE-family HTH domain